MRPAGECRRPAFLLRPSPDAAGFLTCHCEPCGARRGNLAAPAGTQESLRRIRHCLLEIATSGLRPPRNDTGRKHSQVCHCEAPQREAWLSLCLLLPFERACKALSVTFGDSSPRGRAKGLQLNHNDAGGKRSQACSCVPPQKPAQVQPDIRPFSMPFSCVAICPAMRKRPRGREIKHTVRGRNNHGKTKT